MTVSLLEAARLLQWASKPNSKSVFGWHWMTVKHDKDSGFDAVCFKKGMEVVVAILGQMDNRHEKGRLARVRAGAVDLRESIRRQFLPRLLRRPYVYPSVGIDFVREIQLRFPNANIVLIGHSSGSGWASAIAAQLRLKAIGFGGGYQALRTNDYSNNPETISVEIEDDPWGDSYRSTKPFRPQRHRLKTPPGHRPPPKWRPHLIDSYIAALEAEGD